MRFFDNLIDNFSAKDLRSRVAGVIVVGFVTCAAATVGLYFLLTWYQTVSVEGIGNWAEDQPGALTISLAAEDLAYIEAREELLLRLDDPAVGISEIVAKVLSINPAAPSITVDATEAPHNFAALKGFDISIILFEEPLWRMLWGK